MPAVSLNLIAPSVAIDLRHSALACLSPSSPSAGCLRLCPSHRSLFVLPISIPLVAFPHSHLCVRVHPIFADFALCSRILSYITTPSCCHSVSPLGSLILAPVTKAPAPCPSHHINHVLLDACQSRFFPCIAPSARVLQPYRHLIKFSVTSRIPSPQPAHISRCPVCLGHFPLHLIFSCLLYPIFHPITSFCSCLQPYFSNEPEQL